MLSFTSVSQAMSSHILSVHNTANLERIFHMPFFVKHCQEVFCVIFTSIL